MKVLEDIPLAPLTTFRLGPTARYLIEIRQPDELPEAFSFIREKHLPFFVLGGGSNVIFTASERFEGTVLKIAIPGFEVLSENADGALLRIGAGEDWDRVVERAVSRGLSGIEAMSAIPGLAGATPIQNVGAYGTEIADTLESVETYDHESGEFGALRREECRFSYRDSLFKHDGRYVITGITLRLSKKAPAAPDYPGVRAYFDERDLSEPTLRQIREAIIAIRSTKLPDPKDVASVGSFFKNPIVTTEVVERLRSEYERPVIFELGEGRYKVGAGWLIDTLGLKGKSFGNLSFYANNALVVTNNGKATYAELLSLTENVQGQVLDRFGIRLEPEPLFA